MKEDHRGIGEAQRGPHLVLLARDAIGLAEPVPDGVAGEPRRDEGGPEVHPGAARRARGGADRAVRAAGTASWPDGCGRATGRGPGRSRSGTRRCSAGAAASGESRPSGFVLELSHHLLPDDDWLVAETAHLADELGLPVVVTNDVHYARPEGRELQDVLAAIRHGRSLAELRDLRRPDGESYLKGADELLALPPGEPSTAVVRPGAGPGVARGDRGVGGDRRGVPGRAHLRALPLPGLRRAQGRDAVQPPLRRCAGRARSAGTTR